MCEEQVITDRNDSRQHLSVSNQWHILAMLLWVGSLFLLGHKPVHLDEANFLAMTQGDWWAPHNILINWEGTQQRAFDVLSNPPGVVWWLWPVKDASIGVQRAWMLPWVLVSLWGLWRLLLQMQVSIWGMWLFVFSPLFAISHNSLMPEMPLFACIVVGWQGLLRERNLFRWSLILGSSALFRYSGLTMIPLLIAWVLLQRPNKGGQAIVGVLVPTILLCIHDLWVYQSWHFWQMIAFQQAQGSWYALGHKGLSFISMLVLGLGVIPSLEVRWVWVIGSVVATTILVYCLDIPMNHLGWISVPLGMLLIRQVLVDYWVRKQLWVLCWIVGGLVFLCSLRFAATRYWMPFVLPYLVLWNPVRTWHYAWMLCLGFISVHLVWDDAQLAQKQHQLVEQVQSYCQEKYHQSTGYFAGHWGWQFAMEQHGWKAIDDDLIIPNNVCYSYSIRSWPQSHGVECLEDKRIFSVEYQSLFLPIRIHTAEGYANYHSYMISAEPPIHTITPYGWGNDDWDQAIFVRFCRP